jgi:2-beta-glucuronyltransferase
MPSGNKPTVVLVTGHYWYSKRRAGFHWLADAYHRLGWQVLFFTASVSWLSYLRRDHRTLYGSFWEQRNKVWQVGEDFYSYVWFTPFHPANLRSGLLNALSKPLFRTYGGLPLGPVEPFLRKANLFVFESTPGLLLLKRVKAINPKARYVYRVSDDLRLLKNHPLVLEAEEDGLAHFELISTPSKAIFERFKDLHPNVKLHPHGIRKDLFDREYPNPYQGRPGPHLVFVGISHFDEDFINRASRMFPTAQFHIIGPLRRTTNVHNVSYYGEMPFEKTVPFILHADVGLATWSCLPGAESLSDSLKVVQYTYAKLPVLMPSCIPATRPNIITYVPGDDESIRSAVLKALSFDRSQVDRSGIYSWEELALAIAGGAP